MSELLDRSSAWFNPLDCEIFGEKALSHFSSIFDLEFTQKQIFSKEVDQAVKLAQQSNGVEALAFVGDLNFGVIVGITKGDDLAKKIATELIETEYSNRQKELLIFDDLERYVTHSGFGGGTCYINLEYELWF